MDTQETAMLKRVKPSWLFLLGVCDTSVEVPCCDVTMGKGVGNQLHQRQANVSPPHPDATGLGIFNLFAVSRIMVVTTKKENWEGNIFVRLDLTRVSHVFFGAIISISLSAS